MLERTIVRIITGIWKLLIAPDIFGVLLPSHWLEALQPTAFTNIMHIVEVLSHYPSSLPPSLPPFSPPFLSPSLLSSPFKHITYISIGV